VSTTYRSALGTQLPADSVLSREDARRRAANAGHASQTYADWLGECRRLLEEAKTDEQRRIGRGYVHVAELRMRFEGQLAELYGKLAKGEALT
jgi:hypothetical protein